MKTGSEEKYIRILEDINEGDLAIAGGKGLNLGKLKKSGFNVPDGFCLTTKAYTDFTESAGIGTKIDSIIRSYKNPDSLQLEKISQKIQKLFTSHPVPEGIRESILSAYRRLKNGNSAADVAVRSSATAEDLPHLSFAGQQDTYLGINGEQDLLDSVRKCWASLWTARAIGYRNRNEIENKNVKLAVVVQKMVPSESSGVMFTANPLTGKRDETVIDAVFGLGETLVSGQVEPDNYICKRSGEIINRIIGSKKILLESKSGRKPELKENLHTGKEALYEKQIKTLVDEGSRIQNLYSFPQDIEWAFHGNKLYILQSRPVTSLYPLPDKGDNDGFRIWLSFSSWQGFPHPFSPLGRDMFLQIAKAVGKSLGIRYQSGHSNSMIAAGERLFVSITPFFRNKKLRKIINIILTALEPSVTDYIDELYARPEAESENKRFSIGKILKLVPAAVMLMSNNIRNLLSPHTLRRRIGKKQKRLLEKVQKSFSKTDDIGEVSEFIIALQQKIALKILPFLIACVASGQIPLQALSRIPGHPDNIEKLIADLTRGQKNNITIEMDIELWNLSMKIRSCSASKELFIANDPETLDNIYKQNGFTAETLSDIRDFLDKYGNRCIGEIDIINIRWNENRAPLFQIVKNYLSVPEESSPLHAFEKGKIIADKSCSELKEAFRNNGRKHISSRLIRFFSERARTLGGFREMPKFFFINILGEFRKKYLACGKDLTEKGIIDDPGDVFFLDMTEWKNFHGQDIKDLIIARKTMRIREMKRTKLPRLLVSDGTAYFGRKIINNSDSRTIPGIAVSPGTAEGRIRVIKDPIKEKLMPGEILVCTATDPAWTPLFLSAAGLIMEIGGMMTHGSVVAREYGIPAIAGVSEATSVLKTGTDVILDGDRGLIILKEKKG